MSIQLIFYKHRATLYKLMELKEREFPINTSEEFSKNVLERKRIVRLMQTIERGTIAESLVADNTSDDYLTSACEILKEIGAAKIENGCYIFSDKSTINVL